jgi:hypothetical protein
MAIKTFKDIVSKRFLISALDIQAILFICIAQNNLPASPITSAYVISKAEEVLLNMDDISREYDR